MLTAQRPHKRDDGIPTRNDRTYWTKPEIAISQAMEVVEQAGASPALTQAVMLLMGARDRVADHVEALARAEEYLKPEHDGQQKLYTRAELDAAVAEAVDRDRIANFMAFASQLNDQSVTMVYGTSLQARAIFRTLQKAGYK